MSNIITETIPRRNRHITPSLESVGSKVLFDGAKGGAILLFPISSVMLLLLLVLVVLFIVTVVDSICYALLLDINRV